MFETEYKEKLFWVSSFYVQSDGQLLWGCAKKGHPCGEWSGDKATPPSRKQRVSKVMESPYALEDSMPSIKPHLLKVPLPLMCSLNDI